MNVLFDYGNSFLAWAVRDGKRWRTGKIEGREIDSLADRLSECFGDLSAPDQVWISSVVTSSSLDGLCNWVEEKWSVKPCIVQSSSSGNGISNTYAEPETLGSDRWAALVAVKHRYRFPACIIDCGTAITIDLLDADSSFCGGIIFPGLRLLRESLLQNTGQLKLQNGDEDRCLAANTSDGILTGTAMGLIGAIEKIVDCQNKKVDKQLMVYLTGGDAPALSPRLGFEHQLVDDLVLQGLDIISEQEP